MPPFADRRAQIESRQAAVAGLLHAVGVEQLLLLEPANVAWFAGAPLARGIFDPAEQPALVINHNLRWLICSNVDSQRLFDSYLDNLGFQLKEWPWHLGRDQLLGDVCLNRTVACDRLIREAVPVADRLKSLRMTLAPGDHQTLIELGRDLAHALEATCRNVSPGDTELEAAGHLGHRLLHRGIEPVTLHIAADGRLARDSRPHFTARGIQSHCVMAAFARREGLHAAAARTVCFQPPGEAWRTSWDAAGQITAARRRALVPDVSPQTVFDAGQRVAAAWNAEHGWRESPLGWLTGWLPVEQQLGPNSVEPLRPGQAMSWSLRIDGCWTLDTDVMDEAQATCVTPTDAEWPTRRFKFGDEVISLPDALIR